MKEILSVENMRLSDRAYMERTQVSEVELVAKVAETIAEYEAWRGIVAVVCGRGNNGADGLALAALLWSAGLAVTVYLVEGSRSATNAYYLAHLPPAVPVVEVDEHTRIVGDLVFDCVFGTGFEGVPRGDAASAIRAINESGARVVSVDVASGLSADSGMAELCVRSDLTLSIGGYKAGNFLNMARDTYGRLVDLDIGMTPVLPPYHLFEACDLRAVIPHRLHFSNKGDYGYVALIGGSLPYSGAVRLAAMAAAAMRAGAGVVKVATVGSLCPLLVPHVLESTLFPLAEEAGVVAFDEAQIAALVRNVKVVAFGMGIGTGAGAEAVLAYLLAHYEGRLIVDADGLTLLAAMPREVVLARRCQLVLTPHVKEFARLTGYDVADIFRHFIPYAMAYAEELGAVVVLKGATTVVTNGKNVMLVSAGSPGMATAGSGDVLSGVLAATCAYVEDSFAATYAGVYVNGRAGELAAREVGEVSMIASDTVAHIADVLRESGVS